MCCNNSCDKCLAYGSLYLILIRLYVAVEQKPDQADRKHRRKQSIC